MRKGWFYSIGAGVVALSLWSGLSGKGFSQTPTRRNNVPATNTKPKPASRPANTATNPRASAAPAANSERMATPSPAASVIPAATPDYRLAISGIARTGVNRNLPPLEYNFNDVFKPKWANKIGVYGVVQVSGKNYAIVKLPDTSTPTLMAVGQKMYDGELVLKRVESRNRANPLVIFEEDGVEIARIVGDR